ncbi:MULTISPECIES: 5'-methylthioadenosine/S-adenosylhomocysteine nucleosidase [unclassified Variovorax]|uniref:5'-methylthioadenosine/S-adenosylhomocysteine nucleosidase n=1 Tax=unclassified Variovorax TaxID=663243 RepID=UPI0025774F6C|nr:MULTISPECIES: 5'-methylthioadenosine/S-adenosylhomocysteine nucleosidase [unclassified Variovorax]MDM0085989.1 5'-methylthioadenosine/S-adenosylhomocysteine nucleosidase [Variovorax sp. J22G40]MDM0145754.1 5'-methylthioadenosine/S-adenosylhomocysteine nucleosidase [Variovorax sp. J2P1-31]
MKTAAITRWRSALSAVVLAAGVATLTGCIGIYKSVGAVEDTRLDDTPRIAVISAFQPELTLLLSRLQKPVTHSVHGVDFTTGTLEGKPVVLFLSGISMTNATMNTQRVLDRFRVTHIVFSGIAGGVNPALHVGDVTVPAQWGQYLEVLMARETAPGRFSAPPFITDATMFPNFGMVHPRSVEVRTEAKPQIERKFWFEADPKMLAVARSIRNVDLANCSAGKCLPRKPQLVVGGNGVSGQAFMDNKAYREYTFRTFQANVIDMETAAVGMVAYSNGVPYIAFRSLSDLAGGGDGENEMGTFMGIAADNSAKVMLAFLAAWR